MRVRERKNEGREKNEGFRLWDRTKSLDTMGLEPEEEQEGGKEDRSNQ